MAQLNVHVDDDVFFKFKEIENLLKSRSHEKTLRRIILKVYRQVKKDSSTA